MRPSWVFVAVLLAIIGVGLLFYNSPTVPFIGATLIAISFIINGMALLRAGHRAKRG